MSTPARIATALCLLALGIAGAWLFRKPPATVPSVEPGKSELMLRDPRAGGASAALLHGEEAWRPVSASPRAAAKSPLASFGVGDANGPSAPPLPIPHAAVAGPVVHLSDDLASSSDRDAASRRYSADLSGADDEPTLHVVADGDSLESLAKQYLGDAGRAGEILAANREAIPQPDVLPIGLTLTIPRGSPTTLPGATLDDAWRKAGKQRP